MFENLDKKFDVDDTVPNKVEIIAIAKIEPSPELSDEEVSRQALRKMIEMGKDAVENAAVLASGSESPKAYEALAGMIKAVSDSSKDLLLLQKIKKESMKESKASGPRTQNNLFIGSTTELMKALKESEANEALEIIPEP